MPQNILSVYLSHAHSLHRLDQDYALSASSLSFGWNLRMIASTPKYGAIDPALALIEENLVDRTRTVSRHTPCRGHRNRRLMRSLPLLPVGWAWTVSSVAPANKGSGLNSNTLKSVSLMTPGPDHRNLTSRAKFPSGHLDCLVRRPHGRAKGV
jgi:hypothetical protein